MGSLSKETTTGGLEKWFNALPTLDGRDLDYLLVSPKVDGLAIRLRYKDGKLVEGATRGDGEVGQDVLENVKRVSDIPQALGHDFSGEVRGEVYMRKDVWKSFGCQFANPRNGASGGLLQKDASKTEERRLSFLAYSIADENNPDENELDASVKARELGFAYVDFDKVDISDLDGYLQGWKDTKRDEMPYQIDGLVFSLNLFERQEEAGWNGKRPRAKIAWKFPAEQKESSILGVTWQVGRTGKLTPVAHIEPTHIDGSTISNASLASRARFEELGLGRGDKVLIEKGGDIIPQVVRVTWRPLKSPRLEVPTSCPSCGSAVVNEGAHAFCESPGCPSQLKRRVLHWLRRMDVKGAGPSIVSAMCENGLVGKISDLYFLDDKLESVLGSKKIADALIREIMLKSEMPLWRFLSALGIPALGRTASKAITKKYHSVEEIIDADVDGLSTIDGIGNVTAHKIVNGLIVMAPDISVLERVLEIEEPVTGGALSGMSFCLTGKMSRDRKTIAADIEAAGGDVKSSVGKGLTFLVQADPSSASTKTKKAEQYGTKVIGEDQLMEMFNG
jgi:DNA ligase (NAD+)